MNIIEKEAKVSFDRREQKIAYLRARLQVLEAEQEETLQKNEVMASGYRTVTSRVKAMGQTLASQKDVVVGWMKQEQEAMTTRQKCLEIWDTFKGFDFDSL